MKLRQRLSTLLQNDISKDVLRLMTGTIGGRVILLMMMPFVTRLYSPQDFSLLAVYLAIISVIGVVVCMRFDVAIPIAPNNDDAAHLLVLSVLIAFVISILTLITVVLAPDWISTLLNQPTLKPWLWLIPVGTLFFGSYSALQFWATRAHRFSSIALTRISQAVVGVVTMLTMGWVGIAPLGLLLGNLLNGGAGSLRLATEAFRKDRTVFQQVTFHGLVITFRNYYRFPLYSAPGSIANLASIQIPIIIIAAYIDSEAGFLLLSQQMMAAPMTLLGSSISQVYVSRAPDALRTGKLASFTLSILKRLIQIGVTPLVLAGILAPLLFPYIFGEKWIRSGEIVAWLVPWMVLQFLASPISMVMLVVDRQRMMLALTMFGSFLRIGSVLAAIHFIPNFSVEVFAISGAIFYGVCLYVYIWAAEIRLSTAYIMFIILSTIAVIPIYLYYTAELSP